MPALTPFQFAALSRIGKRETSAVSAGSQRERYGLGGEVHPFTLARIPEELYRPVPRMGR